MKTAEPHFTIDQEKIEAETRFDGITVLRTNTTLGPLQAMLRYRELLMVEDLFRQAKSLLRTRPIYHSSEPPSAATSSALSWRWSSGRS